MTIGHELDKDGWRSADHKLAPIERCIAPSDIHELRRVMGLFVQHKDAIPWYSTEAAPLHRLTRKGVPFEWTKKENDAFEFLRSACLENGVLAAPDYTRRIIVATDASDDGKGAMIYQLKNPSLPDKAGNRDIIRYYSKSWDDAMRRRPPYYKEADALITGMTLASYYSLATPFPLLAKTDQAPLRYIDTSAKGPVVAWRIENLGGIPYEIEYVPGKLNVAPDALSRYPMLGPKVLARVGIESALDVLTDHLPDAQRNARRVWLWAGRDTAPLSRRLQAWRKPTNAIVTRSPRDAFDRPFDLAVLIPRAEQATSVARSAIKAGRPACILVPTDLVPYVAQEQDGSFDSLTSEIVAAAPKISICAPLMTWVIIGIPEVTDDAVYAGESATAPPNTGTTPSSEIGSLEEWIPEQLSSATAEKLNLEDDHSLSRVRPASSSLTQGTEPTGFTFLSPVGRR